MLQTTPELDDMLERAYVFICNNRCKEKKCFWGWSESDIKNTLLAAIINKAFLMCGDEQGNIIGLVHGVNDDTRKLFHVGNILTTSPLAMKVFVRTFDSLWPGYSLAGRRYGKIKNYNTPRFKALVNPRKN